MEMLYRLSYVGAERLATIPTDSTTQEAQCMRRECVLCIGRVLVPGCVTRHTTPSGLLAVEAVGA